MLFIMGTEHQFNLILISKLAFPLCMSTFPSLTPLLTFSRRMADNSWLSSKFCGYGIPCAMIVLSSATTGLLDDNALETSGSTWRRLLEDVGRRRDENDEDDEDDELW